MCFVSCSTARISDRQVRAVRKVHELYELFTQSKLGDTDNTGDAEEYERESETVVRTQSLALCSKHEMPRSFLWHLVSKAWILSQSQQAGSVSHSGWFS